MLHKNDKKPLAATTEINQVVAYVMLLIGLHVAMISNKAIITMTDWT